MRIAALRGPRALEVEEVQVPRLRPDEVLVRVVGSGVCASELETWLQGPPQEEPRFLGHEVSGVVVELGTEVTSRAVGERVGVWVTERGFAELVAVRADYCFPAGDGPLDEALAEPLACAANAVELADVRLGDDVVVIGAGFMGQLVQRLVALRGARHLVVADPRPGALAQAAAGATRAVDPSRESLAGVVRELTGGRGADITFECTGTQAALVASGETTRMSGKVAIVNAHFRDTAAILRGMEVGMRLVSSGVLSLSGLVTHRFPLDHINEAFATLRDKPEGFMKAVITFPE